jgi:hypothetical protein
MQLPTIFVTDPVRHMSVRAGDWSGAATDRRTASVQAEGAWGGGRSAGCLPGFHKVLASTCLGWADGPRLARHRLARDATRRTERILSPWDCLHIIPASSTTGTSRVHGRSARGPWCQWRSARSGVRLVTGQQGETSARQRGDRAEVTFVERQQPPRPEPVRENHHRKVSPRSRSAYCSPASRCYGLCPVRPRRLGWSRGRLHGHEMAAPGGLVARITYGMPPCPCG